METIQKTSIYIIALVILFFFTNCSKEANAADPPPINDSNIIFTKSNQTLGNTLTFGLAVGDIDMDNDIDILIANYIGPSKLWLNNGTGTFTQSSQNFDVEAVHDVGIADLNGDTHPDIFLLCHDSPSKVYFNNGTGGFTDSGQNICSATDYPGMFVFGDVDNDNDIDIFISHYQLPNRLWLNDGNGIFTITDTLYGQNGDPFCMELVDVNGDTFLDLFLSMSLQPDEVWMNDGSGNFINSGQQLGSYEGHDYLNSGDIDNDGDNDVVVKNTVEGIKIWLNQDNTGVFVGVGDYFGEGASRGKLFDADLDGDLDLISLHNGNEDKLWLNNGVGSFTQMDNIFGTDNLSIECIDLDGDIDLDIIFGQNEGTGGNSIYFNESIVGIEERNNFDSNNFELHNNYPNPIKSSTTIQYSLNKPAHILLKIYNSQGRNIKTLVDTFKPSGTYKITWNAKDDFNQDVSTGVYYYELTCDSHADTKRMILVE